MDKEKMRDLYIGEIYAKDVYDFCNMNLHYFNEDEPFYKRESKFVLKLRKSVEGGAAFHFPAALLGSLWLVYRGMLKKALIMDAIWIVFFELIFSDVIGAIAAVIFLIIYGACAMPWYYQHIHNSIQKRGLLMRSPEESPELEKSLSKEGEPSVKRAVIYMVLRAFVIVCCKDIMFSIVRYVL